MSRRPVGAAAGLAAAAAAAFPAVAQAHGLVGRQDLPIPRLLFVWAAFAVLVASFVGLAVLWPKPRLEGEVHERRVLALPQVVVPLAGALGIAVFALAVYAGFAGTQTPTANLTPTLVYVLFWVGIAFSSLLLGDWFRAVNPWRAVGRAVGWLGQRVAGSRLPEPLPYPARLGRWPAALGLLAFAWLELVYSGRQDPSVVAVGMLLYAGAQLLGMSLYGVEAWSRNGDAFGVYFGLLARLGPVDWRGRTLSLRPFLAATTRITAVPGTVSVLVVLIGTTSFDGFSQGPTWNSLAPHLQDAFTGLGLSQETALQVAFTLGLLAVVAVVGGMYRLGIIGMGSIDARFGTGELSRRFAHSLLPIALAYVVAHYFSYLAIQGQAIGYLASDPLGTGANYLGTASSSIDYGLVSANAVWYVQVAALILGHVAGLVLAHERALTVYEDPRDATRSQYWMLTVMVAFTCLGLWLLSAQAA